MRRRVVRKYNGENTYRNKYGGVTAGEGFHKRIKKKVKILPNQKNGAGNEDLENEAASERLLNPFSLFNLVRFPNTECTTDRGAGGVSCNHNLY